MRADQTARCGALYDFEMSGFSRSAVEVPGPGWAGADELSR